jgi:lipoyl(octanoyl) transferase
MRMNRQRGQLLMQPSSVKVRQEWLGRLDYQASLRVQERSLAEVRAGQPSILLWVEHPPVITVGRQGHPEHILWEESQLSVNGVTVFDTDRGGDVTFHGPGQLVAYPVFDLAPWRHDLGLYVRNLEEAVIRTLSEFGLSGQRLAGLPGVWVGNAKICAIGAKANRYIGARGYITTHGLALNIDVDLDSFSMIVPCGISDKSVTSLQEQLGTAPGMGHVRDILSQKFAEVFHIELEPLKMRTSTAQ